MQFDPFWMFRAPLSGEVSQRFDTPWFSPNYTVNFAGDVTLEKKIVSEIASYGKQIGWLNEVVLALAKDVELPSNVSTTLKSMTDSKMRIDELKEANKLDVLKAATRALNRLQTEHPAAYQQLLSARR